MNNSNARIIYRFFNAAANLAPAPQLPPPIITKKLHRQHILVLGGNGFIGSNICQKAIQKGVQVSSFNRSGKPKTSDDMPWIEKVNWIQGDIFDNAKLRKAMVGIDGTISTIGGFGTNEQMEKLCGDTTIEAVKVAKDSGIKRFVFISEAQVSKDDIPTWYPFYGYFHGKQRAEAAVKSRFPKTGVCLRPGFVYGMRQTGNYSIPLQMIGIPLSFIGRKLGIISSVLNSIPFVGTEMASIVPVTDLAKAAVLCAISEVHARTLNANAILSVSVSFYELSD